MREKAKQYALPSIYPGSKIVRKQQLVKERKLANLPSMRRMIGRIYRRKRMRISRGWDH